MEIGSLDHAVAFLTGNHKYILKCFWLQDLGHVYHVFYNVYMICWISGTNVIYHVKKYLRFLYVLVKKKPVNFDLLAYNQIVDTIKNSDGRQPIQFPNLIHQVLAHQRKITPLVGDNECIGKPMYLWSIPEKTYHNINQAVRMLRLLQSHVLGGEVINGEKEDDDGEDEVVQETWDERVI